MDPLLLKKVGSGGIRVASSFLKDLWLRFGLPGTAKVEVSYNRVVKNHIFAES